MDRYYKFTVDLPEGKIVQYLEVVNSWPVRQAEYFNGKWFFYSTTSNSSYLADQPVSELDEMKENKIDASEFEKIWAMFIDLNYQKYTHQRSLIEG
jgi:hypothetical protein